MKSNLLARRAARIYRSASPRSNPGMLKIKVFSAMALVLLALSAQAAIIVQNSGSDYLAWKGADVQSITNDPACPDSFVVAADATASSGVALYQMGASQTGTPRSMALFRLKFNTPGTYSLYYRWRTDPRAADPNPGTANSFQLPVSFGDLDLNNGANVVTSASNANGDPFVTDAYSFLLDTQTYTVTQADVDAGQPLIWKIGTREWGLFLDRFVMSLNSGLSEAELNALPSSGGSLSGTVVVALTTPADQTVFTAPTNIVLTANASVSDASVTNVQFYAGGNLLGSATTSPFTITWTNAPAGTYLLRANAMDSNGRSWSSAVAGIVVKPEIPANKIVVQDTGSDNLVWESENVLSIANDPKALDSFAVTNDAPASGGLALFQAGANQLQVPYSGATYALKFKTAGPYTLYERWRGLKERTDQDVTGANSYKVPVNFGDLDLTVEANWANAACNNSRVPPDANNYGWFAETANNITYTVSQEQVDAGEPLFFKIGGREWGMYLDRFALSLNSGLVDADLNALVNSGDTNRPTMLSAVGSAALSTVTIAFNKPLQAASVVANNFKLSGGLTVSSATLDTTTAQTVILATTAQIPGSNYVITVNSVLDASGKAMVPNSKISFTAWKLVSGWITRQLYYTITGSTVADLLSSPKYPNAPDFVDYLPSMRFNNSPAALNFGVRLTAYFMPSQAGQYEFYMYSDDEAVLNLSTSELAADLQPILTSAAGGTNFDAAVTGQSGNLVANQRYLLEVLLKQDSGDSRVAVTARLKGSSGPVDQLQPLSGNMVATYINPDLAITFLANSSNTTATAGSRATFSVNVKSPTEGLYYQWMVNGSNIPGAIRAVYVTPVLALADNGKQYNCQISVAGIVTNSQMATLTVTSGQPSNLQPYIGVNIVGGGTIGVMGEGYPGGAMTPYDVAGVVPHEKWNNVFGNTVVAAPLNDASGVPTPVTVSYDGIGSATGVGDLSGDRAMLQGYIHDLNNTTLTVSLAGVPAGNYNLIVYSVGIDFNATYLEDISLVGGGAYPTYTVHAQSANGYHGSFVRMSSTNSAARDTGNYVMFEGVSPASDGSLALSMTNAIVTGFPSTAVNGLQLVKVVPVTVMPTLAAARNGTQVVISWTAEAAGFTLESTTALGSSANWTAVVGVPKPISGAGNQSVDISGNAAAFYRLKK